MLVVRQRVQVMPGHRVELVAPELNDGEWVEGVVRADADLPATKPTSSRSLTRAAGPRGRRLGCIRTTLQQDGSHGSNDSADVRSLDHRCQYRF
ncbi:MAG: hypothetical protein WKF77_19185 [Planctomycetaceae bacterium]